MDVWKEVGGSFYCDGLSWKKIMNVGDREEIEYEINNIRRGEYIDVIIR